MSEIVQPEAPVVEMSEEKKEVVDQPFIEVSEETAKKETKEEATVAEEFTNGTVHVWKRTHGFLKYQNEQDEPCEIFCHKSEIKSDDKLIVLRRGIQVKFRVQTLANGNQNAVQVQGVNGQALNFHMNHGEGDNFDREIKFDDTFFTGEVKFFSRLRGYGRILVDEESVAKLKELEVSEEDLQQISDLYFKEIDLDAVNFPAKLDRGEKVMFKVFGSSRGFGGTSIRCKNGDQIPEFTKQEREAKRKQRAAEKKAQREAEKAAAVEEAKKVESEENSGEEVKEKRRRKRRRNRKKKSTSEEAETMLKEEVVAEEEPEQKDWAEIDPSVRYEGTVITFSVHRFGFIRLNSDEDLATVSKFGFLKNKKLCFRVVDVDTEQRPPMVDHNAKVMFSLARMENGQLYAINVRDENDSQIVAKKEYDFPEPRELLDEEWLEGEVRFYNWRRGHGRVVIGTEEFYFHRHDIKTTDKVPGIENETKVLCQKVNDPKGPAVTNLCTLEKQPFANQLPPWGESWGPSRRNRKKRSSEDAAQPAAEETN